MYKTDSGQYATVLTPSHIPSMTDPYSILCPPLEQDILGSSMHPFRVRPPSKSTIHGRYRPLPTLNTAQLQDIATENIINNYGHSSDRNSPEMERRNSPELDYPIYSLRVKSTSPTNSDSKSDSSGPSNPISPDNCQISLISQSNVIESNSGEGGSVDTGFNALGCTLYLQEPGAVRDDEVKSESEFSVWDTQTCNSTPPSVAISGASPPPFVQESNSNSSSPSRLPPTLTQGEPGIVGGLQNKIKPVINGVGRGAIGRGVKSKKRLNSLGEHNVGTLETAPIGWGELPMNPKDNFDDGTDFWGQPEKPILKPDNDMLMYLKSPYNSFGPYEMNNNTKHSSQYTSLTDQQKRILQEIMQSNFDFPTAISDDTMGGMPTSHTYNHGNMNSLYSRHFSESNIQGPSMQQFIMQRNVINLLMKQQYLQMQKGLNLEQAIQYLLQETKSQQQKLMSSLYQQGNKQQYTPQINLNLQISNMFINLLQQQLSNVTAQPLNGFPMGNQYINKSMYIPSLTESHTPSYEQHYSTPQEYSMGYPPSQTPRQGQAKNQQWIVQQLVKFHMFNDNDDKNESKSIGKDPMHYTKSLDPSYHGHDSPMKYNIIRSSSLIDQQVSDYNRQRKMNSSMSSLQTDESFNFSELNSLYDAFEDKLIDPEESVFHEPYDRVPPSPSFSTQAHTFSPGALAFYPPGHMHEPEKDSDLFSSLPANLHAPSFAPPSPRLFYPNKLENTLDYEPFTPTDIYQSKLTSSLVVDSLSTRSHNKSPNQFPDKYNPLLVPSNKNYPSASYMPNYMMEGNSNNSMGIKSDLLTHSLPAEIGLERSDAAWLFLTGLNTRIDKTQLERYFSPLGSTSVAHSVKNRTAILTFKQANDAETARNALKSMLGPDTYDTCDICTDPNELSYFIGKFAEPPRSPVRETTPWAYSGLSGSIESTFSSDSSISFPNTSDFPQDDIPQFEEQIWSNHLLPNDLL
ncbi:hypothetical protein LOD99_7275 [Oopsacas minuta]|uniref:RRM domain-containing protein n=1 Tax=Oopsacas minuta TaxID=111878 RepID=A0AAV7JTL6_9METZ|nr:hypothetical protein LOD99_7275 [Oopsacas minuta]